jgi:hypothetical protein
MSLRVDLVVSYNYIYIYIYIRISVLIFGLDVCYGCCDICATIVGQSPHGSYVEAYKETISCVCVLFSLLLLMLSLLMPDA